VSTIFFHQNQECHVGTTNPILIKFTYMMTTTVNIQTSNFKHVVEFFTNK